MGSARRASTTPLSHVTPDAKLSGVVFAHDMIFYRAEDGRTYSGRGSWPWEQYLAFSDGVVVASRGRDLADSLPDGLTDVTHPQVSFVRVPSLSGPVVRLTHRREAKRLLADVLAGNQALVARLPSEIGMLAIEVAESMGMPWAVEVVTCTWDALWNYGTWQGKVYAPVSWAATRRVIRRAPFSLYVTRDFLQRRYPSRGRVVGCSDVNLPDTDQKVLERRLARANDAPRPFTFGTIAALSVRFKGVQTAVEALGRSKAALPPFEYRIVGAGDPTPWRALAERAGIGDETIFGGALPAGDPVRRWLDDVDVYLQPSFQEGMPRALLEAMSRGCPAVASTAGGIPELLEPECLHRPGDVGALRRLIERAASDAPWRVHQSERNAAVARGYSATALDRVRTDFWREFAEFARHAA